MHLPSRSFAALLVFPFALAASACTPPPAHPAIAPPQPEPVHRVARTFGADPFAIDGPVREEWMPLLKSPAVNPGAMPLPPAPATLPPAPAACSAFVTRIAPPPGACGDRASALAALDVALAENEPSLRDTHLAGLEKCAGLPAGLARALRAELAPIECGEAIVAPAIAASMTAAAASPSPGAGAIGGTVHHALVGLAVASRLARTGASVPVLPPPFTRERVAEFSRGPMKDWIGEQATLIEELSRTAVSLPYYAKAITAIEAGIAEMRLVEILRGVPMPDDFAKDVELKTAYYAALDEALDPRKDRGRDATLAGLREMGVVGALHDPRVSRARSLLSKLYGGRRIDALDALLLPALPAATPNGVEERLARKLPTFYAGLLLDEQAAMRPGTLRMLLETGIPLPQRRVLVGSLPPPEVKALFARARIELGQTYFRAVDFDQAAALASAWPTGVARPADTTFLLALAIALRNGPDDATEMMRRAPLPLTRMGNVTALDFLTSEQAKSEFAAMAAFDAGVIRQLVAPEAAGAAYWKDIAERFREAGGLFTDPARRAAALERAAGAEQIAGAVK